MKPRVTKVFLFSLVIALLGFLVWFIPPVYLLKRGTVTYERFERDKGKVSVTVGPKEKGWTPLRRVSRFALAAIMVSEDARFYTHWGIDLLAIKNSVKVNWARGRYARGASTITQQLVRLVFLDPEKTLLRKTREVMGALLLECLLSKQEIMEWYVNLIPLGKGVYGIRDASRIYFASEPDILTVSQGILLALVLPSPNKRSRNLDRKQLTAWGQKRFAELANELQEAALISKKQWEEAMGTGNFGAPIQAQE
ncbi:MAG: transglycosylase domain-containing protein [Deltaproteobacteria bacterium]|nr:transglycosylase domain-containing protein [Deltaproteobacteria bacterium]